MHLYMTLKDILYLSRNSQNHERDSIPKGKHRSKSWALVRKAGIGGCSGQRHTDSRLYLEREEEKAVMSGKAPHQCTLASYERSPVSGDTST